MTTGHYVADSHHSTLQQWFHANDAVVRPIWPPTQGSSTASMFLYEKVQDYPIPMAAMTRTDQ